MNTKVGFFGGMMGIMVACLCLFCHSNLKREGRKTKECENPHIQFRKVMLPKDFVITNSTMPEAFSILYDWYRDTITPHEPSYNLTVFPKNQRTIAVDLPTSGDDPFHASVEIDQEKQTIDISDTTLEEGIRKVANSFGYTVIIRNFRYLVIPSGDEVYYQERSDKK